MTWIDTLRRVPATQSRAAHAIPADRQNVQFVHEWLRLDRAELLEGRSTGAEGGALPSGSSRAYWVGWREGRAAAAMQEPSKHDAWFAGQWRRYETESAYMQSEAFVPGPFGSH